MNIHSQARTTVKIREEIHVSKGQMTIDEAASHFNVSRSTIIKWRQRDSFEDRSHRPHTLHTALTSVQEEIVVELRRSLLLTVDDLLVVVREFIKPDMVRSSLIRLLKRHGVNQLKALYIEQYGETEVSKPKTFKDYEPGYLHVDIKYLPKMPDDPQKRYLLVAIDRATRWVHMEVITDKTAETTARFIREVYRLCPIKIQTILTDNGKEFTDRFTANGEREPTGKHRFDKACTTLAIEHRLIPPKHPQTNGICERFHKTILNEFYQVTFRKKLYDSLEMLQKDLDEWLDYYNNERTHQGKMCCGRTPMETLIDGKQIWAEKNLAQI